jgi:hypothetical protein
LSSLQDRCPEMGPCEGTNRHISCTHPNWLYIIKLVFVTGPVIRALIIGSLEFYLNSGHQHMPLTGRVYITCQCGSPAGAS